MKSIQWIVTTALIFTVTRSFGEDGYRLWLRYDKIADPIVLRQYRTVIRGVVFPASSPTLSAAKDELYKGLGGLLGQEVAAQNGECDYCVLAGTPATSPLVASLIGSVPDSLGKEGFRLATVVRDGKHLTVIAARGDIGVLYGVFAFLRMLQTGQSIMKMNISSSPHIANRILDHWDNLTRTVERGYAGASIWNWHLLPDYIEQQYIDYARANASIGINGSVLTNVNANVQVLTPLYLRKVKALADVFRPYGIKVYLTAKFSAPVDLGGLKTADPLDTLVRQWWNRKCDEIYALIPDFGGFLIKANSEGQPGPQTYGRTHADGANMFADALAPHGGIVIWRAFVYDVGGKAVAAPDRFKQAYAEFTPFDGKFRSNVLIQVKNGPIDFQPREPWSPLFGAMPKTPLVAEFQVTQEYLGQGSHLVYEAPLLKEVLDADTYANGPGSTVARVLEGRVFPYRTTGIAGVSNIGTDRNWTGHLFGQANWYAFGRLAWDPSVSAEQIAGEWAGQTFSPDRSVVRPIVNMMMASREAVVNYMTPLGLHHIMSSSGHYGPGPWLNNAFRADWNPVYYHRADTFGIGFDRTPAGSNALAQYPEAVRRQWIDSATCDERYLLWFHHVSWEHPMKNGRTLWDELCLHYQQGVDTVKWMQQQWAGLQSKIDPERWRAVSMLLAIQEKEAEWWRNACLLYFQTFSRKGLPAGVGKPDHTLDYYKSLRFPYAPGTGTGI